jgi:hypothetical protein
MLANGSRFCPVQVSTYVVKPPIRMTYTELNVVLNHFLIVLLNVVGEVVDRNVVMFNVLRNLKV